MRELQPSQRRENLITCIYSSHTKMILVPPYQLFQESDCLYDRLKRDPDTESIYPLFEQIALRLGDEEEEKREADYDSDDGLESISDGGLWMKATGNKIDNSIRSLHQTESSQSMATYTKRTKRNTVATNTWVEELTWSRQTLVNILTNEQSFKKFSDFCKADHKAHHALRFYTAYNDLILCMSDQLATSYRLSLRRATTPTYAVAQFLSQPPIAPGISIPTSLVPKFKALWEKYLKNRWRECYVGDWLPGQTRMNMAVALTGNKVWCGVLDECAARILERLYKETLKEYIYGPQRQAFYRYPTPPSSPTITESIVLPPRHVAGSHRLSLISDSTMASSTARSSSPLPAIQRRSSSLGSRRPSLPGYSDRSSNCSFDGMKNKPHFHDVSLPDIVEEEIKGKKEKRRSIGKTLLEKMGCEKGHL